MTSEQVITRLRSMANPAGLAGMAHFGITTTNSLGGISSPTLQKLAKEIGRNHDLAQALWASGIHEARLLACMVDDPRSVTEEQMERWVRDFDSWDICDTCCGYLFDKTPISYQKALEWTEREEEYVKRAGFALMAYLTVHDKKAPDGRFLQFLPAIRREATDDRNFVKKAVNWALRQIGKRNKSLNEAAIEIAREIAELDARSARWIASDALRELTGEAVQRRLQVRRR
ncbi:MAG TPA: DNA alkylation repair protein [Chloroflexia bacterium]|nr:DNA alkylation repair protein [Chloroflexia bacterium]